MRDGCSAWLSSSRAPRTGSEPGVLCADMYIADAGTANGAKTLRVELEIVPTVVRAPLLLMLGIFDPDHEIVRNPLGRSIIRPVGDPNAACHSSSPVVAGVPTVNRREGGRKPLSRRGVA